ncbi:hypothetical protein T08_15353 [Trichinella sp. T8]|nr:hypothetical protein T08_15353 [Trichinella sp. T8]
MYKLFSSLFDVVCTIVGVMNLLPTFLVFFLANLRCEFAIKYRYPYFKFELEDEYMELFRYSNLVTPGETITVICENAIMSIHCADSPYFISLPCIEDSDRYCKSCDATNSSKLMFSYTYIHQNTEYMGFSTKHVSCNSLIKCEETYEVEDVSPVVYYEDGDFHPTSHCSILTKDIVEIPSVLIFSHANISRGIPFEIYLVDELNEKKRLLRYFEFVELPVGGMLYFEINSVELVTCYLYTDDSFIGFFAVSELNPTISLNEIRHNYGICEFEMLCEGRLNALHRSIVAYTRQTFVILESPVMWEYASYKPQQRSWKSLSLLKCDDVLFQVLQWDTQNIVVTLQIWDLTEGKMLSNDTFGNRVTFRRGNNQYAVKVKAIYDRCNPRVLIERDFEVLVIFQLFRMITVWNAFIIESLSLLLMTVIVLEVVSSRRFSVHRSHDCLRIVNVNFHPPFFCYRSAIKYRYPYFKFELEDEYLDLFRYSNLPTEGKTVIYICDSTHKWIHCKYNYANMIFPCFEACKLRGNDSYCKYQSALRSDVACSYDSYNPVLFSYVLDDSYGSCKSCDATGSSKLMFTYTSYSHRRVIHSYIVEIPSVLIFSHANISRGIPFEIYLVDELNEKKRLLRYFEFVELPVGGMLYFEINSVELVTCYLYTDDSFIGFFAVSELNPTISLNEIRHNYGICEFEMLCEGRLNALHRSIVAYTRHTFVILESPVMWEYASYKPQQRSWKSLSLLKCDDVLFQVLRWDTQNIVVTLQIWDLTEGRMLSNDTFGNRVTFRRGNNQYAVKVKAIYDRCNPRVLIERDFEVLVIFQLFRMITVWNARSGFQSPFFCSPFARLPANCERKFPSAVLLLQIRLRSVS